MYKHGAIYAEIVTLLYGDHGASGRGMSLRKQHQLKWLMVYLSCGDQGLIPGMRITPCLHNHRPRLLNFQYYGSKMLYRKK